MRTLAEKWILNARPRPQAGELSELLAARGAKVLEFPGLEIQQKGSAAHTAAALKQLRAGNWILFTSANGVQIFVDSLRSVSLPSGVSIGVVGKATARAAEALGLSVAFIAHESSAAGLGKEFVQQFSNRPLKALLVRGERGDPALPDTLKRAGVEVDSLFVYDSAAPNWSAEEKDFFLGTVLRTELDMALITSADSLRNLTSLCEENGALEEWRHVPLSVIGETTANAARALGFETILVSREPEIEALCSVAENFFTQGK